MAPRLPQKESPSLLPSHHDPEKARLQAHFTQPSPSARQEEDVRLRERMPSPKYLLTTLVVAFLVTLGLAAAVIPRDGMPCHDMRGHQPEQVTPEVQGPMPEPDSRSFADLLEQVSPHSLHRLLSTYFPRRYRHGVFESEHHALEAVHADDPELASSIVKIAKRQDNNSTDTPTDTATQEPDSNTPTPTPTPTPTQDTDTNTPTPTPSQTDNTDSPDPTTPTQTNEPDPTTTTQTRTQDDTTSPDPEPTNNNDDTTTTNPPATTNQSPSASTPAETTPTTTTRAPDETTSPVEEESTTTTRAETPDATGDDTTTTTRTTQNAPTTSTTTTRRTSTTPNAATEEPEDDDDETTTNKPTKTTSVSMKKTSTPVTATFTSTKPNGEITLVTTTSYVEGEVPVTETGEAGSLQTDDAASVPNIPALPALAGAILGGLALL